jgi:hypothetical protein
MTGRDFLNLPMALSCLHTVMPQLMKPNPLFGDYDWTPQMDTKAIRPPAATCRIALFPRQPRPEDSELECRGLPRLLVIIVRYTPEFIDMTFQ